MFFQRHVTKGGFRLVKADNILVTRLDDGDLSWSDLIGEIYDAASGEAPFRPLAPKIAAAFNSGSCVLQVRNGFAGPIEHLTGTPDYTAEMLASHDSYYLQDVWANPGIGHSVGSIMGSGDFVAGSNFRETTIYRQHDSVIQSFYLFHVILPIGGPDSASGILGIHRSETESPFSAKEKRQGEMLLPHLKRALQLRERLARLNIRQQAMLQTMDSLALGVMLVTSKGRVQFANPVAEDLLRRRSGLAITENRLHATAPPIDPEFQRLLGCASAPNGRTTNSGGLIRLPRQGAKPLSLSIYPFLAPASDNGDRVPSALIFIGDSDLHKPPCREVLAKSYGLTGAEAKLFEALLAGQRLQDYADQCSISLQTVKTQLSCLFHKTGSARQTDLVRDGLSNPILSLTRQVHQPKNPPSKSLYSSIPRLGDARMEY